MLECRFGRGIAALMFAANALTAGIARADPADPPSDAKPAKVVILADASTDGAIVARIEAELRSLGFAVAIVRAGAEPIGRDSLEASSRAAGAAAAIRVAPANGGVDVWVVDRVTGKAVLRSVSADDAATIAIRAVELLRASLLETESPHPSRGEVATDATVRSVVAAEKSPPSPTTSLPSRTPPKVVVVAPARIDAPPPVADARHFGLRIAPGVLWSSGGLASSALLEIEARIGLIRGLELAVFGTIPLGSVHNETSEGTLTTRIALAGVGVVHPFTRDTWWILSLGGGVGASWLHVVGAPNASYLGSTHDTFGAVPYLAASFAIAPIPVLRIGPSAFAGVAIPGTKIESVGSTVETFGRPILAASFGVELVTR